jgi:hypothetical protein
MVKWRGGEVGSYQLAEFGDFFGPRGFLGSEYSDVHKVHTLHAVSARVNFVKFVWVG